MINEIETNIVLLQNWICSIRDEEDVHIIEDGVSLHYDTTSLGNYIDTIYKDRINSNYIPFEYDRVIGKPIIAFVSDDLMELLKEQKNIRLTQVEFNNLSVYNKVIKGCQMVK